MKLYVKNKKVAVFGKCQYSKKKIEVSLQARRLYGDSFHKWKTIHLCLIKNVFGNSLIFNSKLAFKRHVKSFPHYYREINWKRYHSQKPEVPSCILYQNLWYN